MIIFVILIINLIIYSSTSVIENGYSRSKKINQGIEKPGCNVVSQSRENVRTSCSRVVKFLEKFETAWFWEDNGDYFLAIFWLSKSIKKSRCHWTTTAIQLIKILIERGYLLLFERSWVRDWTNLGWTWQEPTCMRRQQGEAIGVS